MCDYTQVNYQCGHVRYVVKACKQTMIIPVCYTPANMYLQGVRDIKKRTLPIEEAPVTTLLTIVASHVRCPPNVVSVLVPWC